MVAKRPAPAKKAPAKRAAPNVTSTGQPAQNYTSLTGSSGAGTAVDTSKAPPLSPDLATWIVPGSAPAAAAAPAASTHNPNLLQSLARELHVTGDPGADLENKVIAALAQHFNVKLTGETPAVPGRPDTRTAAQKKEPNVSNPFPQSTDPMFQATRAGQQRSTQQAMTSAEPAGGGAHPGTETTEPNSVALEQIAKASGAKNASLESIAAQLAGSGAAASGRIPAPNAPTNQTAAQQYANVVKNLQSTTQGVWYKGGPKETYKQYMAGFLESANYLNASANQGTPDTASIAGAFGNLLKDAKAANKSVADQAAANSLAAATPSGAQPTQTVSETAAFVQGMGEKLGIYLSPADITKISNMYEGDVTNAGGPTTVEDEIKNTVIQYFNPNDPRNPPGAASDMYQQVLQSAQAYGIPVASANIMSWVTNGIMNSAGDSYSIAQAATDTAAAAATHFQTLAEGLYPTLAPQIASGQKVADLISPYNSITSQYTGVAPTTLADPGASTAAGTSKYFSFLQGGKDPSTGAPTLQTMDQWRKTLMQDPQYGFQKTQGAQDMAEQLTAAILNEFGRVNTMGGTSTPVQSAYGGQSDLSANTAST